MALVSVQLVLEQRGACAAEDNQTDIVMPFHTEALRIGRWHAEATIPMRRSPPRSRHVPVVDDQAGVDPGEQGLLLRLLPVRYAVELRQNQVHSLRL